MARVSAAPGLTVRVWPGQFVAAVFAAHTVSTHLVSEIGAAVLELAAFSPVSALDTLSLLDTPEHPVDCGESSANGDLLLMEDTITGLVAAGLLRRVE